ncbi:hypothetical protein Thermo_01653 [Thermoplasmatales archaeon]|nr:hypothetical protein Thermo_01653 [Thermoplasmatales archaeon]
MGHFSHDPGIGYQYYTKFGIISILTSPSLHFYLYFSVNLSIYSNHIACIRTNSYYLSIMVCQVCIVKQ